MKKFLSSWSGGGRLSAVCTITKGSVHPSRAGCWRDSVGDVGSPHDVDDIPCDARSSNVSVRDDLANLGQSTTVGPTGRLWVDSRTRPVQGKKYSEDVRC
jgi:hypothetical protein